MKTYRSGRLAIAATMLGMAALGACTSDIGYLEGKVVKETEHPDQENPMYVLVADTPLGEYVINVENFAYAKPISQLSGEIDVGDSIIFPLSDNIDRKRLFDENRKGSVPSFRIVIIKNTPIIQQSTSGPPERY
ncbi:MAG: hypothetical protein HYU56_02920 [Candidatus Aenigmarchaeota archaeon]|nr:hypothetical protein [Candidatus Aenigmarchaeota archaeon]